MIHQTAEVQSSGIRGLGRGVAVDLIGAGDSDKLTESGSGSYSFATHADYFPGSPVTLAFDLAFAGEKITNLAIRPV